MTDKKTEEELLKNIIDFFGVSEKSLWCSPDENESKWFKDYYDRLIFRRMRTEGKIFFWMYVKGLIYSGWEDLPELKHYLEKLCRFEKPEKLSGEELKVFREKHERERELYNRKIKRWVKAHKEMKKEREEIKHITENVLFYRKHK